MTELSEDERKKIAQEIFRKYMELDIEGQLAFITSAISGFSLATEEPLNTMKIIHTNNIQFLVHVLENKTKFENPLKDIEIKLKELKRKD